MKRLVVSFAASMVLLLAMPYCKKGGGGNGGGGGCSEAAMTITTSPANGTVEPAAPGPNFPLTVNITTNLPTAGATIEVKARPESSTTTFFTESKAATGGSTTFSITSTPVGVPSVVEVTVTSKSCNTNKVTASYKFSRK